MYATLTLHCSVVTVDLVFVVDVAIVAAFPASTRIAWGRTISLEHCKFTVAYFFHFIGRHLLDSSLADRLARLRVIVRHVDDL